MNNQKISPKSFIKKIDSNCILIISKPMLSNDLNESESLEISLKLITTFNAENNKVIKNG